jgi:hypothetical protein
MLPVTSVAEAAADELEVAVAFAASLAAKAEAMYPFEPAMTTLNPSRI